MFVFFFFKQKTAYEMRISDWSSDVCSSDLLAKGCVSTAWAYGLLSGITGTALGLPSAMTELSFRTGKELFCSASAVSGTAVAEIGRASCRESVCQYV